MEEAIYDFFEMIYTNFIQPIINSFDIFVKLHSKLLEQFFDIIFNWLFNIFRETPYKYFYDGAGLKFIEDIILYAILIISIILIYKVIKAIFKPIFKLLNVGGDTKWRR